MSVFRLIYPNQHKEKPEGLYHLTQHTGDNNCGYSNKPNKPFRSVASFRMAFKVSSTFVSVIINPFSEVFFAFQVLDCQVLQSK